MEGNEDRADDPTANGEWMKRDRRGQNGNNAGRYYFLFAASDQPPTRNHSVHPPLIHSAVAQP